MKWDELGPVMKVWWGAQFVILAAVVIATPILWPVALWLLWPDRNGGA